MPNLSKHKFNRRNFIKTSGIYSGLMVFANASTPLFGIGKTGQSAKIQTGLSNLRCEYLVNPKSIDTIEPRLSWEMLAGDPGKRSLFQSAYRVLAASSPDILNKDQGDLWDSGKVQSDATAGIAYNGIPLTSRTLCYWKVQIWNQDDQSSGWSQVSKFTMGLLNPGDWKAKWISYQPFEPQTTAHFGYLSRYAKTPDEIKWVQIDLGTVQRINAVKLWGTWMTGRNSVRGGGFPRRFKIELAVRSDFSDSKVVIDHTGDDYPNPGLEPVLLKFTPSDAQYVRLTATKLSGEMEAVWDENSSDWKPGIPTGGATDPTQKSSFLALAEMEVLKDGVNVALGKKVTALDAWEDAYFNPPIDDIPAPRIHGGWSPEYLTNGRTEPDLGSRFHNQPVTCLRREFTVGKTIENATLYATALGAYEFRLNGERIGDHQLAPAWTLYSKRVLYQTYDVTGQLRSGPNALAAMLGDGWFRMRGWDYFGSNKRFVGFYNADDRWLLGQLEIEYADGTMETIATDGSWKCNSDGPLRHTSMYDGVFYDARRELPGWDKPGLMNKQGWTKVVEGTPVNVPVLSSQSIPPIRIIRELKSLFHKELRTGVYVYDFGEQLAGVCRIRVNGPAGTEVKLRFAQALKEDGSLYVANLMGSYDNQDVFILDGSGSKTFIPPFTYHGFRYVEVSGIGSTTCVLVSCEADLTKNFI